MLYQLSYASTAQTEKIYQNGTSIARAPCGRPVQTSAFFQRAQIRAHSHTRIQSSKPHWKNYCTPLSLSAEEIFRGSVGFSRRGTVQSAKPYNSKLIHQLLSN